MSDNQGEREAHLAQSADTEQDGAGECVEVDFLCFTCFRAGVSGLTHTHTPAVAKLYLSSKEM